MVTQSMKPKENIKCPGCEGKGGGHLWKDRDPIEGYKLAANYACFMCDSQGTIGPNDERYEACKAYWEKLDADRNVKQKIEAEKARRKESLRKHALGKLTKAEREALGIYED